MLSLMYSKFFKRADSAGFNQSSIGVASNRHLVFLTPSVLET